MILFSPRADCSEPNTWTPVSQREAAQACAAPNPVKYECRNSDDSLTKRLANRLLEPIFQRLMDGARLPFGKHCLELIEFQSRCEGSKRSLPGVAGSHTVEQGCIELGTSRLKFIDCLNNDFGEGKPIQHLAPADVEQSSRALLDEEACCFSQVAVVRRRVHLIVGHIHWFVGSQLTHQLVHEVFAHALRSKNNVGSNDQRTVIHLEHLLFAFQLA
mmetsp:Transcript_53545/g.88907  ORF Transcript_53545/g.88907 Transcript_53545/m.88907 type:complete len:216 (-) Transcript_53545:995-1642(-)